MRHLSPWLVVAFAFCVLAGTSQMLPLVWDEGELIGRAASVRHWGGQVISDLRGHEVTPSPFSQEAIAASWKSTTVIEGHPGGYLAVIAMGRTLADLVPQLPQKTAWRLGPILLMSLALGVLFSALRRHFGTVAALFSVIAVLLVPRVFAHMHFATCDGVLVAAWLLAVATFPLPRMNHGLPQKKRRLVASGIVWGLCFGLTLAAKFTGWAAGVPFLLVIAVPLLTAYFPARHGQNGHSKKPNRKATFEYLLPYLVGLVTALFVFYLLNPPIWHRPFAGFAEFLHLNTHRGKFNIAILFWGRMYDLDHPLPWYNTLVWVAITFPTLFFATLPFGIHRMFPRIKRERNDSADDAPQTGAVSQRRRFSWLVVLNALVLLVVRAVPGTPPHDGVRLFVPAFPFLAIIAGIGMSQLWQLSSKKLVARLVVVLMLVTGTGNLVFYAPQWLSFYNAVIGGVDGASRKGFEPTYYWDALDAEVIAVLNANTEENEKVCFTPSKKSISLDLVRAWDGLRPAFRPDAPGEYRWYVFQCRPSGLTPVDRVLLRDFEPAYVKCVSQPSWLRFSTRQTPVLYVFSYEDYLAASELAKHQ